MGKPKRASAIEKICHNCNHSFRIKNIKEGFLFRFKGLTWTKANFFLVPFLFSLVFVVVVLVSSPCSDVITTFSKISNELFGMWHVLATYEFRLLHRLRSFQSFQSPLLDIVSKLLSFSFPAATNASFALHDIIISVSPCPYLFPVSIRNIICPSWPFETLFPPFSLFVKKLGKKITISRRTQL